MGGMFRRPAILGGIALLGAGIIALVLVSSRTRKGADPVREGPSAIQKTNGSASRPGTAQGSEADAGVAGVATPRDRTGWTLRGRLVRYPDPDALDPTQPVAGALVRLTLGEDSAEPKPDVAPREVRSGPDGKYGFEGVPGKAEYRLDVEAEGCALRAVGFELGEVAEPGTKEIPDMVLDEPVRLLVILKGPGGILRDDGTVRATRSKLSSDRARDALDVREESIEVPLRSSGEYVLERCARGSWWISASAPGCVKSSQEILVPREVPLELLLEPGSHISGRVVSDAGEPLEGAEVKVEKCVPERLVRAAAGGSFDVEDLPGSGTCVLSATADGFGVITREMEPGLEDIELVLIPEGVLAGRVLSRDSGQPIGSATIVRLEEELARTDEKGFFEVRKLDPGYHYDLEVHSNDHVPSLLDPVTLRSGERVDGIEVRLDRGVRVEGRVQTEDSKAPVAAARVHTTLSKRRPEWTKDAVTLEDGSFSLSGMAEGEYVVRIQAHEYVGLNTIATAPGTLTDWTFAIQRGGSISGRVLDPDGHPLQGINIHKQALDETLYDDKYVTDHRGRFRFEGLPPQNECSLLFMDGHGKYLTDWVGGIRVVAGEEVKLADVRVQRGKVVRGRVLDAAGAPLRGAEVRAFGKEYADTAAAEQSQDMSFARLIAPPLPEGWTGANGEYRLEGLLAGRYKIEVSLIGRVSPAPRSLVLKDEAEVAGIDFVFPSGGTVSGRVMDEAGKAVEGAWVTGQSLESFNLSASTTTDASGYFELLGLTPGGCSLRGSGSGVADRFVRAEVPSTGNVLVLPALATISGKIDLASGQGKPPPCSVIAKAPGQPDMEGTSDSSGRFVLAVTPGGCLLHVEGEGFASPPMKIHLQPGEKRHIVLKLEKAGNVQVELERDDEEPMSDEAFVLLESARPDGPVLVDSLEDQNCLFAGVLPGAVKLVAFVPGRGVAVVDRVEVTPGETVDVSMSLGTARGVHGRVLSGDEPVQGARVTATWPGGSAETRTSAGGVFELRDVEPGTCELVCEAPLSTRPLRRIVQVAARGGVWLYVHLDRARVGGIVTSGGRPVAGVEICFQDSDGDLSFSKPTDAAGRWSLELEAPGRYLVQVYGDHDPVGPSRPLVLESPKDEVRVDFDLEKD